MRRSFSTTDLVQLPKLDASAAQTLGTEVVTAAKAQKNLPAPIDEALDDLEHSLRALQKAAARRLPILTSTDPLRSKAADVQLDAAWSGTFDWLTGWSKLSIHPESARASLLLAKLFPEGLKFILLAYKLEWAESNTRLLLIKSESLAADFEALGGEKILKALQHAHKEYGEALGITNLPASNEPASTTIRDALDDFATDLRAYVLQVSASVSKKAPKTAELAEKLLAPITAWETPGGKPKAEADPPADTPGDPPAAPPAPPIK